MKRTCWAVALALSFVGTAAHAQSAPTISEVVTSCGSTAYGVGQNRVDTQTTGGSRCVAGTVSVTAAAASTSGASGTVLAGGTFQQVAAANTSRKSLDFINICNISGNCMNTSDKCYLSFTGGTPTLANSIPVPPGGEYLRTSGTIPSDAIQATCDNGNDHFFLNIQ